MGLRTSPNSEDYAMSKVDDYWEKVSVKKCLRSAKDI